MEGIREGTENSRAPLPQEFGRSTREQCLTTAQQLLRWVIPFGHNRHGPKSEGADVPLSVGELSPHLTHCRLGRDLPPYQVAS